MIEVRQHPDFKTWLDSLLDKQAQKAIAKRLVRVEAGLMGDVEPVGEGISELKLHVGPGYRLYLVKRGLAVIVLLCGGDKSTQTKDIKKAKELAEEVE